jgi:hypothetical protein
MFDVNCQDIWRQQKKFKKIITISIYLFSLVPIHPIGFILPLVHTLAQGRLEG